MLQYLIQVIGFQLIFLIIYDFLLKKETFFNYNRLYLLITIGLSFVLPFIKITRFQNIVPDEYIVRLPEVVIGEIEVTNNAIPLDVLVIESSSFSLLKLIFFIGLSIALFIFLRKLYKIYTLAQGSPKERKNGFVLVKLFESNAAFSFFNLVFIGETLEQQEKETILKHEIIHVKQKHTVDLLIFELLRIVFWFNPLIYMYQNRVASLHEYIADSLAINQQNKKDYYQNLLQQVFDTKDMSFTNTFFNQSLIKKRIVMLTKERSKQVLKLKYALLIPVVCSMMFYSSISSAQKAGAEQIIEASSVFTEKVDAIKEQIMIQGNVTDEEEKGIDLLLSAVEGKEINHDLIQEIQRYTSKENKTILMSKIAILFEQMQVQGNVKPFEERALKKLLVLTTKDGFNNAILEEVVHDVEVPLAVIDEVPVHEACKGLASNRERKKCMADKISEHVLRNFNTKTASDLGLEGKQRIAVIFKIDKNGDVINVRARASHSELEKEAIRVVEGLPRFIPGKHKGKEVIVPYSLPIMFNVEPKVTANPKEIKKSNKIGFNEVDVPPVLISCVNISDKEEQKKCTKDGVAMFVNKNFNMKIAEEAGLTGKKHRIEVLLKISKQGNATSVKVRAPHPDLEEEVKRVINALPEFIPGKHEGKKVDVMYTLPIMFYIP